MKNEDVAIAMGWVFGENEYGVKGWTLPSGARCGGLPDFLNDAGQIPVLVETLERKYSFWKIIRTPYGHRVEVNIRPPFNEGRSISEALCNAVVAMGEDDGQ